MTQEQFNQLAAYAMSTLDPEDVDYCWYRILKTHLYSLTDAVKSGLRDAIDDWCSDNDIDPDEFYDSWDLLDIWEWDPDSAANESVNESYSGDKHRYSAYTKGDMLEGLKGLANIMLKYEEYTKAALKELTDYYTNLGIKVVSAAISGETRHTNSEDGFVMKLDKASVMEYLVKNGVSYDIFDESEPPDEYIADDLKDLTLGGWIECGENMAMLFETVWATSRRYDSNEWVNVPYGDLYVLTDGNSDTVEIDYCPALFDGVDDIIEKMCDSFNDEQIKACAQFA